MLYKYNKGDKTIKMLPSYDFENLDGVEKDLENLLANNLEDFYSEDGKLMTIFQERPWQPEPDILAVDKEGNLYIFELKRGKVDSDTIMQIMRYCQKNAQKDYYELNSMFQKYSNAHKDSYSSEQGLQKAHQEAFGLDVPLSIDSFNKKQRLIIIGSAANIDLINAMDYWKGVGLDIDFIPYRFYDINGEHYFEFFAKPYDYHIDTSNRKGVIFDTCRSYNEDAIWDMLANNKVSAYGSNKVCVDYFNRDDYVFYYHKGIGIVAAGRIKNGISKDITEKDERYMDVELLTPKCMSMEELKVMPVKEIRELMHKNYFWARTAKVPYLSVEESEKIVNRLKEKYNKE